VSNPSGAGIDTWPRHVADDQVGGDLPFNMIVPAMLEREDLSLNYSTAVLAELEEGSR
jgi:hypothetical protein